MSIALSTLVIILLILPGIGFRRFYYPGEFSGEYFKSSIGELLLATLIPSLIIHSAFFWWDPFGWWDSIDKDNLRTLGYFLGLEIPEEQLNKEDPFQFLREKADAIVVFLLCTTTIGCLGGWVFKFFIRKSKLDRKVKMLRFKNQWHYLFSGEILDFRNTPGKSKEIEFSMVNALVATSEGPIIYSGILADYVLSKLGGMDRIYLTKVSRRKLSQDDLPKEDHFDLPGDYFVIPFSSVMNLDITYYGRGRISGLLASKEEE